VLAPVQPAKVTAQRSEQDSKAAGDVSVIAPKERPPARGMTATTSSMSSSPAPRPIARTAAEDMSDEIRAIIAGHKDGSRRARKITPQAEPEASRLRFVDDDRGNAGEPETRSVT
jgi:hypothetical protein